MEEFYCDVCFEHFGKNLKCPRMLTCGHSFCLSCILNLLVQSPSCPNCKQEIQFTSVDGIPVVISLNGLNTQLNFELEMDLKEDSVDSLSLKNELLSKELPFKGYCEDHRVNKNFRCMECKCYVCGVCATINHKSCRTILVAEALEEMKKEIRQEFKAEIEAQKLQSKNLDKNLNDLEKTRLSIKNDIKIFQLGLKRKSKLFKLICKDIENLQSVKSDGKNHCEKLKLIKNSIEETTDDDQFMEADNKWKEFLTEANKLLMKLKIPRYSLCHFSLELLRKWCEDGSVYASRCQNGSTQYGKVVVKGERVWVHCFKPQKPNQNDVIISVEDCTTILKNIVIATNSFTPRAMNFLLLCLGVKGRSYEDLTFVDGGWRIVTAPNQEGAVVKGITDGGVYKAKAKIGFVCGFEAKNTDHLSRFLISMRDNRKNKLFTKFGFVEKGMDVCERIFINKAQKFTIKHCGLVI